MGSDFKVGDVVQLKGSARSKATDRVFGNEGHYMTVIAIHGDVVGCAWIANDGLHTAHGLPMAALVAVPAAETATPATAAA